MQVPQNFKSHVPNYWGCKRHKVFLSGRLEKCVLAFTPKSQGINNIEVNLWIVFALFMGEGTCLHSIVCHEQIRCFKSST